MNRGDSRDSHPRSPSRGGGGRGRGRGHGSFSSFNRGGHRGGRGGDGGGDRGGRGARRWDGRFGDAAQRDDDYQQTRSQSRKDARRRAREEKKQENIRRNEQRAAQKRAREAAAARLGGAAAVSARSTQRKSSDSRGDDKKNSRAKPSAAAGKRQRGETSAASPSASSASAAPKRQRREPDDGASGGRKRISFADQEEARQSSKPMKKVRRDVFGDLIIPSESDSDDDDRRRADSGVAGMLPARNSAALPLSSPEHPLYRYMAAVQQKNAKLAEKRQQKQEGRAGGPASAAGPSSSSASSASSLRLSAPSSVAVPPEVSKYVRGLLNKITLGNAGPLVYDMVTHFQQPLKSSSSSSSGQGGAAPVSSAVVLQGLFDEIHSLLTVATAGSFSSQTSLSIALVLRALQLQYRAPRSAFIVEHLCQLVARLFVAAVAAAPADADRIDKADEAFERVMAVVGDLFLLSGAPAAVLTSLLAELLQRPARLAERVSGGGGAGMSDDSRSVLALRGVAGAVSLLSVCHTQLSRQTPEALERALPPTRAGLVAQLSSPTAVHRYEALLHKVKDMVVGHGGGGGAAALSAKHDCHVGRDDIEEAIRVLCDLVPENASSSLWAGDAGKNRNAKKSARAAATNMKLMRQLVTGGSSAVPHRAISFSDILRADKPPQWWQSESWRGVATSDAPGQEEEEEEEEEYEEFSDEFDENEEEEDEEFEEEEDDEENDEESDQGSEESADGQMSSSSSEEEEEEEEMDEYTRKRLAIEKMRKEETVLNSQNLFSEEKKEMFKIIITATDDLECFQLLTLFYTRQQGQAGLRQLGGGKNSHTYARFLQHVVELLLQGCQQEQRYNPYYFHVLSRFLSANSQNNKFAKMVQFCLWDVFKDIRLADTLGSPVDVPRFLNLASLIADLFCLAHASGGGGGGGSDGAADGTLSTSTTSSSSPSHGGAPFTLALLRGLDLGEGVTKSIGLFSRLLLLRLLLRLPSAALLRLFFGGDAGTGDVADTHIELTEFRQHLAALVKRHFVSEAAAAAWIPVFYSVTAIGTPFEDSATMAKAGRGAAGAGAGEEDEEESGAAAAARRDPEWEKIAQMPDDKKLQLFQKRIKVVYTALRKGID